MIYLALETDHALALDAVVKILPLGKACPPNGCAVAASLADARRIAKTPQQLSAPAGDQSVLSRSLPRRAM